MSYAADHLAWQQRVNQEFNAAARFMDRMYAQRMGSSGGNPLGVATAYSQNMYGPKVAGAYVAKSRLKDGSNASVRSKSMRSGMSRRSQLSKNKKPSKRFNEDLDAMSIRSRPSQHPPKQVPQNNNTLLFRLISMTYYLI